MVEDIVRSYGLLTLGSRLRRIGERLQADTQAILDAHGVAIAAGQYPLLAAVDRLGPLSIGDLAEALGVSQPGVTRSVTQLASQGLLDARPSPDDQRRRIVALTPAGVELVAFSRRVVWPQVEAAVADVCRDLDGPLLSQLSAIEDRLAVAPLKTRGAKKPKDAP